MILFGIQRIWFLLLVPVLLYLDNTNFARKVKTIISTSLFAMLININSLNKFLGSIFNSNSQYNILKESPGHNTPSIYLGLLNVLNIDSNIFLLLIYVLVCIFILILILRKYKMSTEIKLITTFTLVLIINPYLKPYHFIFIIPCLLLVSDSFLKDKRSIITAIIMPNLFWIIFSNLSSGTSLKFFQLFIIVFIINHISLVKEKNEID